MDHTARVTMNNKFERIMTEPVRRRKNKHEMAARKRYVSTVSPYIHKLINILNKCLDVNYCPFPFPPFLFLYFNNQTDSHAILRR